MDFDDGMEGAGTENISPDSPEEDDDDSIHSSSSSDFSSDESDSDSPMDVGYGTPVMDEEKSGIGSFAGRQRTVHIVDESEGKSIEKSGQGPIDNPTSRLTTGDENTKTTSAKNLTKRQESNSPRIEINIKNEKSFSRVSIDDHVELDFDESEDEDLKRDWRHEKRVTQEKKVESEEEGAVDSDDDQDTKAQIKITRQIGQEVQDEDCEEGEIKSSDEDTSSPDEEALDEIENPQYYEDRIMCRYFQWGNCHFGMSCRFLHPGVNDYGYGPPPPPQHHSPHYQPPVAPSARAPSTAAAPAPARWPTTEKPLEKKRSPTPEPAPASPPTESAWERGLRHAKKMRELAKKRKEKETDFEEKRMNMSLEVVEEEKEVREKSVPKSVETVSTRELADPLKITREVSQDREEVDPNMRLNDREPEQYREEPYPKQDAYYDKNYQDDYYDDRHGPEGPEPPAREENWGRKQQYDNYYSRGDWDNRENEYPPQGNYREQRYNKEYPPNRGKYNREGGAGYNNREPPFPRREPHGPPPQDFSPEKEREYWDRRREEDYRAFNKSNALRENVREEEPVNRIRGEQWSDPWARVKEPPRRKGSRSRSHSRGRKSRRSYSNSSSSSFSSSSRSRSRSSSSSSSSSRSSYSSSSSRSRSRSRSRGKRSKEKNKPVKLHAQPPKSDAIMKPLEGPPKSTVTKVPLVAESKRSGNVGPNRSGRDSDRSGRQPPSRGPPSKGSYPGPRDRDRGASSKVPGPPSSSRGSGPPTGRMGGPQNNSNRPGAGGPGGRPGGSQTSRDRHPPSTRPGGPPGRSAPGKPGLQQGRGESSRESLSAPNKGPPHQRVERTSSATQDRGGLSGSQGRRVGAVEGARNQSGQKREECMASVRGRREQLPKNASPKRGSADRDRKDRDSRQLPGRMRPRSRSFSSSSSSRSRSRSYSRSISRSSRGSSVSSSSSSSSSASYSSGRSADSEHMYRGIRSGRHDRRNDSSHRKIEAERGDKVRNMGTDSNKDRDTSHYQPSARRDPQPSDRRSYNRDRKPQPQDPHPQGRSADPYSHSQRDSRERRGGGGDRGGQADRSYRSARPTDQRESDARADSQKSAIKLTLKSNDKVTRPVKRSISNGGSDQPPKKGKQEDHQDRSVRKPAANVESPDKAENKVKNSSPSDQPKKKSMSTRREELLKQLKAVENAICRKRSKMS